MEYKKYDLNVSVGGKKVWGDNTPSTDSQVCDITISGFLLVAGF